MPISNAIILNANIKMLRSTLSYLSFGLVSESVETEVAEVPVPEVESKVPVETTSPVEDNWVILGQDLTVSSKSLRFLAQGPVHGAMIGSASVLTYKIQEERPKVDDPVSVPVQNIDDRPSRRNKKLAKRKAKGTVIHNISYISS